jgi:hypothetical protein
MRYTAAQARQRFFEILDEAEAGTPVVVERRGVRFEVRAEVPRSRRTGSSSIEILDQAVDDGNWSWALDDAGLQFSGDRSPVEVLPSKRPRR